MSEVPPSAMPAAGPSGPGDPVLDEIVRRLATTYVPEPIYLFGSRARGSALRQSDYDILVVVTSSSEPMHRRARPAYAALRGIPAAVDVLVWTRQEFDEDVAVATSLPATVAREGALVHAA